MMFTSPINQNPALPTTNCQLLVAPMIRPSITKQMSFVLCSFLLVVLAAFSPNTMHAAEDDLQFVGGFVVIIQGLTDGEEVLEYDLQKMSSSFSTSNIVITVFSLDGSLVQEQSTASSIIDFSNFSLPSGKYMLTIQVGGVPQTVNVHFQK